MDLYAYALSRDELVDKYIKENYGDVPRLRGVRFMKIEQKTEECDNEAKLFNKYAGKDVIYIHTRCGNCGYAFSTPGSNYKEFEADKWEEAHKDLFLEHINEDFDETYCTHYFKAVKNADYFQILKQLQGDDK